jgi:hypothetical protein
LEDIEEYGNIIREILNAKELYWKLCKLL